MDGNPGKGITFKNMTTAVITGSGIRKLLKCFGVRT